MNTIKISFFQKENAEQLAHDTKAFQHNMSVFAKDNESVNEHKYFDSKANETRKLQVFFSAQRN
jgi:hypothetical protein